jgi:AcrR family transcriptional regulator
MSGIEHRARNGREKAAAVMPATPGMDRRARRTRQALHEALIQLMLKRDYDQVTVADVADAANVGRSTFYAHYTDKDDLLRDGFGHLKAELRRALDEDPPTNAAPDDRLAFSRPLTEHLADNVHLYRALMAGSAGPIAGQEIQRVVIDFVRSGLAVGGRAAPERTVQLVAGSYLSLVTWWLDRGAREPAAEIDRAFLDFARHGLARGR